MKVRTLNLSFFILMAALLTTDVVFAQSGSQYPYSTKESCTQSFFLNTGNNSTSAAENFCKNKYPDPILVCAQEKLNLLKKSKTIAADDELNYINKFKEECIKVGVNSSSTTSAATTAATGSSATPTTQQEYQAQFQAQEAQRAQEIARQQAAANRRSGSSNNGNQLMESARILSAGASAYKEVRNAYDGIPTKSTPFGGDVAKSVADVEKAPAAAATSGAAPTAGSTAAQAPAASGTTTAPAAAAGSNDPKTVAAVNAEAGKNQVEVEKAAKDAKAAGAPPEVVDGAQGANPQANSVTPPPTPITAAAEQQTTTLTGAVKTAISGALPVLQNATPSLPFSNSATLLTSYIDPMITKYATFKKTCTTLAEKTEFVCAEGTSPGQRATRALMAASGPLLAVMNSAQGMCSTTSKITDLASKVLIGAKLVCSGAKITCGLTCASAVSDLQALSVDFDTRFESALELDQEMALENCSFFNEPASCNSDVANKFTAAVKAKGAISTALRAELGPTLGTSPSLVAKCEHSVEHIIGMTANVVSLAAAQKSAEECERRLASGGDMPTQQYCAMAGNSTTQFCKCQRDNTQEGCSGYLAMTSGGPLNTNTVGGTNLKSEGSGPSSFAGGGPSSSIKPSGDIALPTNLTQNNSNPSGNSLTANSNGNSGRGSPTGGSGLGGSGSSGSGSSASNKNNADKPEKKWSFGAFANKVGNLFKGGGGKSSKSSANGSVTAANKADALAKRKLASEKLSSEVTQASGKSNWDKVHRTYTLNESTFISGQ